MSAILGFFLFIIIIVLVVGLSIVGGVLRFIFGLGRKVKKSSKERFEGDNFPQEEEGHSVKKKIFDKDDGEYVDFEEIKEDK